MKIFTYLFLSLVLIATSFTGFGAEPSKPDFAFPETVSKNADAELKAAIKANNGPATVRALINRELAFSAINPDDTDGLTQRITAVRNQVKSPLTAAVIDLLLADALCDDERIDSLLTNDDTFNLLQAASVDDWKYVVKADRRYYPTMLDVAVSRFADMDSFDAVRWIQKIIELRADMPSSQCIWYSRLPNFKSLNLDRFDVYEKFSQLPVSCYPLIKGYYYDIEERQRALDAARQWLQRFESTAADEQVAAVKSFEQKMLGKDVKIWAPTQAYLGRECGINIRVECVNKVHLTVKLGDKKVLYKCVHFDGVDVFKADSVFKFTPTEFGRYRVTALCAESGDSATVDIAVSNLAAVNETFGSAENKYALDVVSGNVVPDAEVVKVKDSHSPFRFHAVLGDDQYSCSNYLASGRTPENIATEYADILTDRAIYKPGDEVKFCATFYACPNGTPVLQNGVTRTIALYNARDEIVEKKDVTSNSFGRAEGSFTLPDDGLTGRFSVRVMSRTVRNSGRDFTVAEYKLPTFEVEMKGERQKSDGAARVFGTATSYSGFPIANAKVKLTVKKALYLCWFFNFNKNFADLTFTSETTTDAQGQFSVVLPDSILAQTDTYYAEAIVTSDTGESHEASSFMPNKPLFIVANFPSIYEPKSPDVLPVKVIDVENNQVDCQLTFTLKNTETGDSFEGDDWSNVPSGSYDLVIAPVDESQADEVTVNNLIIYRTTDAVPPIATAMWLPKKSVSSGDELQLGTSFDEVHVRYTLWSPDRMIEQKWLTLHRGITSLKIDLPEGVNDATLSLWTLHDFSMTSENVTVRRSNVVRNLQMEISSIREHVAAGDRELWTVRVVDNLGNPASAAVMLNVYSKALDVLSNLSWSMPFSYNWTRVSYRNSSFELGTNADYIRFMSSNKSLSLSNPSFELYDRSWPVRIRSVYYSVGAPMRSMKFAATNGAAMDMNDVLAYSSEDEAEVCSVESADAGVTDGAASTPDNDIDYRLPELPVALWAPMLTTNPADGSLQVQFEVPNANTTWAIRAFAFDEAFHVGNFSAETVASKPVMVQPTLPRFLCVGDKVTLPMAVMNNTDSAVEARSFIELFDPITEQVVARQEFTSALEPMSSATVSLALEVGNYSSLGVRTAATVGNFTDGERTILPVLPATVTVRHNTPLFYPADSTDVRITVPAGSVVDITANAAWECVMALPGLQTEVSSNAFSSTSALFSAAVAAGLLKTYPQIATALSRWQEADTVLVSRLQQNEDLKIALLESTPWSGAAQSDSERMARLLLLLDRKQISSTIETAVNNLSKLQHSGGLYWYPGSQEPSLWVTVRVLSTMAQLKRLGYLPENNSKLMLLIYAALKYVDDAVARAYVKSPKSNYADYVAMRSAFTELLRQPSTARKVTDATVQRLVSEWRDMSFAGMGEAAVILAENSYQATAAQIVESLSQHKAWRQVDTYLAARMLDAFIEATPGRTAEIDAIRLHLMQRKQSMEWGDGLYASDVVAAILHAGASSWLVPAENELSLTVNGVEQHPAVDAALGRFRLDLPDGGELTVRKGRFPAWGGIFTFAPDSEAENVAEQGCDQLTVKREIIGEVRPGNRITLRLTLKASQPMDYVVVYSPRAATFEPVDQLPGTRWLYGLYVYREPRNTRTAWYFNRLAKGETTIDEDFYVTSDGEFLMLPAEAQSQYVPEFQAHSSGTKLK